jgi:hypothetical protein|tara:strand:- start:1467 stop:2420 length:954 start_codon:yes stop_codon:yes gene_type:complete
MERTMTEDAGLDKAFETTYLVVTGKLKLEDLGGTGREVFMLYDPILVEESELVDVLNDVIDYYIETEEYEKCQEIKNLLDSNLSKLIPKITYSDKLIEKFTDRNEGITTGNILSSSLTKKQKEDSIDKMIDILKHFSETEKTRKESNTKSKDVNKSKRNDIITIKEFWSILSSDDKDIFSNDLIVFEKWVKKLDPKVKEYYIERLVEGKTLIPPFEGFDADISDYKWPEYNENDKYNLDETYDSEEEIDYENKVVISFIDNFTCISNYDIAKINRIKFQLLSFGILETEIRTKKIEDKILYTLVYDGQQNINKIDWD